MGLFEFNTSIEHGKYTSQKKVKGEIISVFVVAAI